MSAKEAGAAPLCPRCGARLSGAGSVDELCSTCLLSLALSQDEVPTEDAFDPLSPSPPSGAGRSASVPRTLTPLGTGIVTPAWAMPAELLRQAAQRLRLAAIGVALFFVGTIVVVNLFDVTEWQSLHQLGLRNLIAAFMITVSGGVAWLAHSGRLAPTRLLLVSLGYEVLVAFGISLGDHLEPMGTEVSLTTVSWLCVWIVIFPVFVPASPRWALVAGVLSATTWPLAYFVDQPLGNPPAPLQVLLLNSLDGYFAAAVAMFATAVIRGLQELGCYRLVERLDHGGMGEIWRAKHRMLARPVAVKLIRPELLGVKTPVEAASLVARFQREAEATSALHSSHTISLHDFGVTPEGAFYYVMELLDGLDLETLVRRYGPVPPERAIHILIQACDSLAEAHATGLIHRDVKPSNILTCHWGLKWDFVKVLDFGLVKTAWSMGADDHLTSEGTITGTPAYMAPEAALGGVALDARVDLYGLGCVGYWLLTGERVFVGRTPVEVLMHHIKTPPVPPSERSGREIPEALETLVLACLAKEPGERPQSAEWLATRLAECETAEAWTPERAREWWETARAEKAVAAPPRDDTRTPQTATAR
jgi:eukaryotic-like serine/threonine-protein kinase